VDIARYSDHARQYHSMEVDTPSFPKSEEVIATRSGDVLIKQTLLKADHFPKYACMLRSWASASA
jgi:hypothetical protein